MSAWSNGTYTKKGLSLLSKLTQGNSLRITRVVSGTGYVTPTALANQTAVSGIKQELSIKTASYPETGVCKLPVFLTNKGINGYKARQIGVYANDPDDGEILYFISQSSVGTEVPSEATMPDYSATWTFYFRYGQADNVSITVDPSHAITEDMLNEVREIAETGISAPNDGSVLAIDNTANLPLANLRLFGKTTQNGTPTQNAPVDLVNVGASGGIGVTVYGKNLLNIHKGGTTTGVTETISDGLVSFSGTAEGSGGRTAWARSDILTLVPGIYCLSMKVPSGKAGAPCLTKANTSAAVASIGRFTISEVTQVYLGFNYEAGETYNAKNVSVQLEVGSIATDYDSCKPSQPITVSTPNGIPGIPVPSGGNYTDENGQQWICDEIDFARGVYVQRVQSLLLAANLGWTKGADDQQTANTTLFYGYPTDKKIGLNNVICDRFETKNVLTSSNDFPGMYGGDKNQLLYIRVSGVMTLDDFKAWLTSNPTNIIYELKTPVETALTASEIAAFESLHSNNPYTTIINDGGANMEADCFQKQHEPAFNRLLSRTNATFVELNKQIDQLHESYFELSAKVDDLTNSLA